MNFKIKLKKLINQIFDATENLIYSFKYLPQILFFGLWGILFYEIYSVIFKEVSFIPGGVDGLFYLYFIYINAFINPIGKNAFTRGSINRRW